MGLIGWTQSDVCRDHIYKQHIFKDGTKECVENESVEQVSKLQKSARVMKRKNIQSCTIGMIIVEFKR